MGRLPSVHAGVHQRNAVLLSRVEGVTRLGRISAVIIGLDIVQYLSRELDVVVCEFTNLRVVDTQDLSVLGRP